MRIGTSASRASVAMPVALPVAMPVALPLPVVAATRPLSRLSEGGRRPQREPSEEGQRGKECRSCIHRERSMDDGPQVDKSSDPWSGL